MMYHLIRSAIFPFHLSPAALFVCAVGTAFLCSWYAQWNQWCKEAREAVQPLSLSIQECVLQQADYCSVVTQLQASAADLISLTVTTQDGNVIGTASYSGLKEDAPQPACGTVDLFSWNQTVGVA